MYYKTINGNITTCASSGNMAMLRTCSFLELTLKKIQSQLLLAKIKFILTKASKLTNKIRMASSLYYITLVYLVYQIFDLVTSPLLPILSAEFNNKLNGFYFHHFWSRIQKLLIFCIFRFICTSHAWALNFSVKLQRKNIWWEVYRVEQSLSTENMQGTSCIAKVSVNYRLSRELGDISLSTV